MAFHSTVTVVCVCLTVTPSTSTIYSTISDGLYTSSPPIGQAFVQ